MNDVQKMTKPETMAKDAGRRVWLGHSSLDHSFELRNSGFVILALCLVVALFANPARGVEVLEEIIEQKYTVDADVTLSIRNSDGAIRIYAADVSEISIQALKKAYTSDRLNQISIDVKSDRKSVQIDTKFPPKKSAWSLSDRSGTVEYTLIVPQTTRITRLDLKNGEVLVEGLQGGSATAHLVNGWLAGHNCFGDLDLTVVNGRLDVAYDWWENKTFTVRASSVNANIRAIVPSDASLHITGTATSGKITNDLAPRKQGESVPSHVLDITVGSDAESALEIKATSGNIRIDKAY